MPTEIKAFGTLKFDRVDDTEEADEGLAIDDDPSTAEVRQLVLEGVVRKGRTLVLTLSGNLTADANMVHLDTESARTPDMTAILSADP